jgi:hypothetical protein
MTLRELRYLVAEVARNARQIVLQVDALLSSTRTTSDPPSGPLNLGVIPTGERLDTHVTNARDRLRSTAARPILASGSLENERNPLPDADTHRAQS